ncbi:hypothetical protein GH714_028684 [Hevea brasiliensis]|uniref:KIB1-4 beta-propeller domain-containing protein n=1 Tax=Hevea brasiliensis TaxID=3981 RepID=A0A6A6N7R5_HEVBR|nr:hypothetical protein GH714_028684 [Hevea brasiliensis]
MPDTLLSLEATHVDLYLPPLSTDEPQPILSHTLVLAMAIKEKKKSKNQLKSSCNKEPNTPKQEPKSPKLWPDLPQQLIYLIERQPTLIRNIFSRGLTKSWRAERSKCNPNPAPPWLQLTIDDQETADNQPCTFNIWFAKDPVVYAASSSNPVGYRYHKNKCTVIVLTGIARPAFAFYKLRQKSEKWIKKDSSIIDPHCSDPHERAHLLRFTNGIWFKDKFYALSLHGTLAVIEDIDSDIRITALALLVQLLLSTNCGRNQKGIKKDSSIIDPYCSDPHERAHLLRFTNGIWFKDKFYALSLHGTLAVIEDIDSDLRITALGKKRAVPSVSSKRFGECMIESEGGILLVFLVSRDSINVVDCVEIYQLNIDNLTWTKKESLRNVTLIMGANCCMSVSASRVGCRRNCVYFTLCSADGWWVYDLETGIISTPTKSLHWANPTEICLL